MAKKTAKTSPTQVEANVGEIFSKSERFIETYRNHIIIAVAAIILIVVAILGIRQYYFVPKEGEAQAAIFPGENYLAAQQWELALNGDDKGYIGFLGVIEDYGMTKTANLANAYAGICYYHLNKPEDALTYLKKYSGNDKIITPVIHGLIGDCYVNTGKLEESIKYFTQTASEISNDDISPRYLKKAAIVYENLSDYANAEKMYRTIKDKYPNSQDASDIDKYIERAKLQIK
jgi:tetratricopeptide (TPR) repeat protein